MSDDDRKFLVSFESGEPQWALLTAGDLNEYPSVKWKLQNILKLKETKPEKFAAAQKKLRDVLFSENNTPDL